MIKIKNYFSFESGGEILYFSLDNIVWLTVTTGGKIFLRYAGDPEDSVIQKDKAADFLNALAKHKAN